MLGCQNNEHVFIKNSVGIKTTQSSQQLIEQKHLLMGSFMMTSFDHNYQNALRQAIVYCIFLL